jgi:hypothetical protein
LVYLLVYSLGIHFATARNFGTSTVIYRSHQYTLAPVHI